MGPATSGSNGPIFVVNMKDSSRTPTKWRVEYGTPGCPATAGAKCLYCTCTGHTFGAKLFDARIDQSRTFLHHLQFLFHMLRYFTSGESHGEALVAFLSGLPAGLAVDQGFVDRELWRRQQGFGRGGRMKIETDRAHFLSGVHHGKTIGSPIAVMLENRDWQNWKESLPVETGDPAKHK